ncbi:hypothetical protein T4B_14583 [Trichinella pseudospiralis]|uniref:Uncharacterized protein n=1 Tax=Trichinella pseudospiralis TaxID=6337 RepID=A0A0V1IQ20_TRIPS|nr:hypothetical protein T4A_7412 [Trichinella pseudospiralis]KRZ24879.1 hypothetical protein T4B_14583 [Trichinella pseudospiralis]KRZ41301.1 hypothetical protein T4C_559 [Trichinella pseudospiralis]
MTIIIPFMTLSAFVYLDTVCWHISSGYRTRRYDTYDHKIGIASIRIGMSISNALEKFYQQINLEVHEMEPLKKPLLTGLNNRILRPKVKETED